MTNRSRKRTAPTVTRTARDNAKQKPEANKTVKTNSQKSSEDKRARIREAAYRCFKTSGYHDTSVDAICKEIGISKGAFYWYFTGKRSVFLDILDTWAKEVEEELASQFHKALVDENPYNSMTRALQLEGRRGRNIMPVWLEFLSQVQRVEEIREVLQTFHHRIRSSIDEMLRTILPAAFGSKDRHALASVILAIFIGLISQEMVEPTQAPFSDTIRRFMSALKFYVENAYVDKAKLTPL